MRGWIVTNANDNFHFKSFIPPYNTAHIELIVTTNLEFTILVYGWSLTNDSFIYADYHRSMKYVTVSTLLKQVKSYVVCEGILNRLEPSFSVDHNVPCEVDLNLLEDGCPVQGKIYYRAKDCNILLHPSLNKKSCERCIQLESKAEKCRIKQQKNINTPAQKNAPLSQTHRHRLELALKTERAAHKKTYCPYAKRNPKQKRGDRKYRNESGLLSDYGK